MSRKKGPVETPEYLEMVARQLRAAGRRVADADVEDLTQLLELRAVLDDAIATAVAGQRGVLGRSWADIARATGHTRQAASQRWGKRADQAARTARQLADAGQLTIADAGVAS